MVALVFFNLLVNSIFSLIAGLLIVYFFIWLFRIQTGPWKLALLSLPFLKIVYDFLSGVPHNSIIRTGIDPFSLPPKHHVLKITAGFDFWGPKVLAVFNVKNVNAVEYSTSFGDHLGLWLHRTFGHDFLIIILSIVITISIGLLFIRIVHAVRFEKKRMTDRKKAHSFKSIQLGFRKVDVYISESFSGSPFTGGVLSPYICIPKDAYQRLNNEELEAVIDHELGHIKQYDILVTIFIQALGDIFWFIPGYRMLSKKINRLREVVADQWAVRLGANPTELASSLVKLKEMSKNSEELILYSAFIREKSLLKTRIDRLLEKSKDKKPRFGWQYLWVRVVVSVWVVVSVMRTTFGGNQNNSSLVNPQWIEQLLKLLGI